jgi:transposase-like protein
MTIAEICAEHGVSRQTLHRLRADPGSGFPEPLVIPGSTRAKYPRAAVAAYFAAHPLRPGRRTDLESDDA